MSVEFSLSVQYPCKAPLAPKRPLVRKWVKAALRIPAQIAIRVVDLDEGRQLNSAYRNKDYATNVLTFVYDDVTPLMGDIVLCAPVIEREAAEQGKEIERHYAHLVVHGVLHLQGFDHENEEEAGIMERLEGEILTRLGYPDPYLGENNVV